MIPLFLIKTHLGKKICISQKVVKKFPKFYQEILTKWRKYLSFPPKDLSAVASQFIWYNEYIKIGNNAIYYRNFSQKNLNHIGALFESNSRMRSWGDLREKLGLDDNKKFYWRQIIHAISRAWKEMFLEYGNNISDLIVKEHHLVKKHQIYYLEKLNIRELYNMQLILKVEKPTAQTYFEKNFQNPELEWKDIPYLDV